MTKEPKDKTEEKKSNASESSSCMDMMANMMARWHHRLLVNLSNYRNRRVKCGKQLQDFGLL